MKFKLRAIWDDRNKFQVNKHYSAHKTHKLTIYIYAINIMVNRKGNVLFNDALNTFFIYGYMASDICKGPLR